MQKVLVVPGYTNSGPAHWQSIWERRHATFQRVEQADWERPRRAAWVAALDDAVTRADGPAVLLAHSLGCITVAHWALQHGAGRVRGAFLVSPADVDAPAGRDIAPDFAPVPLQPLPYPSIVVASATDPYLGPARARLFAAAWGSTLVDAGDAGHINTDSGHGPWPDGERLFHEFVQGLDGAPAVDAAEYLPIDCSLHDRLEAAATLRRTVRIRYRTASGDTRDVEDRIADIFARQGVEYLRLAGAGEVRLDRIVMLDGIAFETGRRC